MELPIGFVIDEAAYGESRSLVFKLNKNLYGIKQSKSIDFVLAFLQADLDVYIWMELPIGFVIDEAAYGESLSYVLKMNENLYGLKQASLNWYDKIRDGLIARDFVPYRFCPCFSSS